MSDVAKSSAPGSANDSATPPTAIAASRLEPAAPASEPNHTRRHFLIGALVVFGGLYVGRQMAKRSDDRAGASPASAATDPSAVFGPNPFVRVGSDDSITLIIGKSEMGQGVYTSLAMLVAEELEVDPKRIHVKFAPADPAYNSTLFPMQFTGGSSSVRTTYDQLRKAGATARTMLVAAAAQNWQTDASTLSVENGVVSDGTRSMKYGELVELAAKVEAPKDVQLKDPKDFKVIGKSVRRLDGLDKVTGRAEFGLDVQRPDMLYAMVARAPIFGSTVVSFDDKAARAIPGVYDVKLVPSGVAVLATNTWAARRGRDALEVNWADGAGKSVSTTTLRDGYRELASKPGGAVHSAGDVEKALSSSDVVIEAEYEVPYLSHSCMEPLNCTVHVTEDKCDVWSGTQFQSVDHQLAAEVSGLKPEQVQIHTTFLGGGFGRRGNFQGDVIREAVAIAKGVNRPVKVVWTREDDTRGGFYRPFFIHRMKAGIDEKGSPVAWRHTIVGQSIIAGTPLQHAFGKGPDRMSHEGVANMPYAIANFQLDQHDVKNAVPVQFWRSVGHSATGFIVNGFIDELAVAAGRDPVELRRELLADKPRHLAVLNLAAEKAGWGKPLPEGRARGVALQESFGSIVAQVAEVSVSRDRVRVHRVVCTVDCGPVVNPDNVAAQIEGGIVYGLSAALHGAITLNEGRVEQGNFNDYPVLRMDEMPRVETHLIASNGPMGGVGEISVPPIAPAVCNAIYAATGKRIRRLPIAASLTEA